MNPVLLRRAADVITELAITGGRSPFGPNESWVSEMPPAAAEALAAWLRNTADWVDTDEPCPHLYAVALACSILGVGP